LQSFHWCASSALCTNTKCSESDNGWREEASIHLMKQTKKGTQSTREEGNFEKTIIICGGLLYQLSLIYHDHVLGPKIWPGGSVFRGVIWASAVFFHTLLPHQLRSIPPFGICKVKNMTMRPRMTPASSPVASR